MTEGRQWSEEEDKLLRKLWSEGASATEIGMELAGRSRNAIIGRVHRLKLPKRRPTRGVYNRVKAPGIITSNLPVSRGNHQGQRRRKGAPPKGKTHPARLQPPPITFDERKAAFVPLPGSNPIPQHECRKDQCHWPVDTEGGVRYCGMPVSGPDLNPMGLTYCDKHYAMRKRRTKGDGAEVSDDDE